MVLGSDTVGLCRTCRHHREITTQESVFWRCGRSDTDPAYPRYPQLPVHSCAGYERLPMPPTDGDLTP